MPPKLPDELLADIRASPNDPGVFANVLDDLIDGYPEYGNDEPLVIFKHMLEDPEKRESPEIVGLIRDSLVARLEIMIGMGMRPVQPANAEQGGRRASQRKRFDRCVKAVRKTVKARKGSSKESAAIAICTKTILHPRGRTIKRYRKGRLLTQKRR